MNDLVRVFGPVRYPVPKVGEHGRVSCFFGRHWLAAVRQSSTGRMVAVACTVCRRTMTVHDLA